MNIGLTFKEAVRNFTDWYCVKPASRSRALHFIVFEGRFGDVSIFSSKDEHGKFEGSIWFDSSDQPVVKIACPLFEAQEIFTVTANGEKQTSLILLDSTSANENREMLCSGLGIDRIWSQLRLSPQSLIDPNGLPNNSAIRRTLMHVATAHEKQIRMNALLEKFHLA